MIIAIGGIKGGIGKSTTAINMAIASVYHHSGDTLLIDADEQGTTRLFNNLRNEAQPDKPTFTCLNFTGGEVRTETLKLRDKYPTIFIDVGGRDTASLRAALLVADYFIVPFEAASFGLWTLEEVENLVEEAKMYNETLKAYSFINKGWTTSQLNQNTDNSDVSETLTASKIIKFTGVIVGNRKIFSDCGALGLGITEAKQNMKTEKALLEFSKLEGYVNNVILTS